MTAADTARPRTNRERTEESAYRLLMAAIELFADRGYERTTAAEIGTRAGYSRNMVRDRYGSKEALLQALFEREFSQRLLPALRRERTGSGLELVLGQTDDLLTAIEEHPAVMRAGILLAFEGPIAIPLVSEWFEQLIANFQAEMVEHLDAGVLDGSVRTGLDHAREAEVYVSYGIGLCYRWVAQPTTFDFPAEIVAWRARLAESYGA
jgi:AcrR family transcriptional regulator